MLLIPQNAQCFHDSKAHSETETCPASFSTRKRFPTVPTASFDNDNDVIWLKFENASFSILSKVESPMKKLSTFVKSIHIAERITGIETWSIPKEPTFPILLKAPLSPSDMLIMDNMIDEKSSSSSNAPLSIFEILHFENIIDLFGIPCPIR